MPGKVQSRMPMPHSTAPLPPPEPPKALPAAPALPDPLTPLRVLIVEDNATVAVAISLALNHDNMQTRLAATGHEGLAACESFHPDIVLLDLELPDVNGMELLGRFAAVPGRGVIVVTVAGAEAQRIAGLEHGADDYIVKPAPLRELAARIRAVHRRLGRAAPLPAPSPGEPSAPETGTDARVRCDLAHRQLLGRNGAASPLTEAEAAALQALLEARGAAVSRARLSEVALKRALHAEDRSVDQIVLKLRRKIATFAASERVILSMRRLGYVMPQPSIIHMQQP